jgi:hypothetical protein
MIYEFDDAHLVNRFVRPTLSLIIKDSHDQDMEYDGARARLKMCNYPHIFRYRYSDFSVASQHFSDNLESISKLGFKSKWTAFWCFRRLSGSHGMTYIAFNDSTDAVIFKLFWRANNVRV